jgi:stage II sporulation protein D
MNVRRAIFLATAAAWAGATRWARATGGRDADAPVAAHEMRVLLASDPVRPPEATPIDAYQFRFGGRTYRGRFETAALADGRIGLIDVVPLDAYVYGVVSKEVSAAWPRAALETQAIVARTYALTRQKPNRPYDVVAGDADQVYGGVDSESVEGRDAVDATGGMVVTYDGAPARLAFGSCCGGHTADAASLWGGEIPYLRGVADPHCTIAPEFHWRRDVPYDECVRALGSAAGDAGPLVRIELRDVDQTGRPLRVALVGARSTIELKATAFRTALGTAVVRSTLLQSVDIERDGSTPSTVSIAGAGYGHGVGLCQWGARAMAQEGADAARILQFYFPQTALGRA